MIFLLSSWLPSGTFKYYWNVFLNIRDRSSHQRCSMKKGALRNFANFTGKHLCQSLWLRWFPVDFEKFFRTPFSQNTSGRLLLKRFKEFSIQNIYFLFWKMVPSSTFPWDMFEVSMIAPQLWMLWGKFRNIPPQISC